MSSKLTGEERKELKRLQAAVNHLLGLNPKMKLVNLNQLGYLLEVATSEEDEYPVSIIRSLLNLGDSQSSRMLDTWCQGNAKRNIEGFNLLNMVAADYDKRAKFVQLNSHGVKALRGLILKMKKE